MAAPTTCPVCFSAIPAGESICPGCGLVLASISAQSANPVVRPSSPPAPTLAPRQTPAPLDPLQIGQRLAGGRYTLIRPLSKGGMGQIYLAADHEAFDRQVVVKVMLDYFDPTNLAEVQSANDRFLAEARTLSSLRHPGIPQIYGFFQDGARNLIVMEYIEGHDLDNHLTHLDASGTIVPGKPFPQPDVLRWAVALCKILEYLASRQPPVVHHDIKPANLLLDRNSNEIRLVDFGTAKSRLRREAGAGVGVAQTDVYGTHGYAAPEQYRGESEPRSDVYALAATLYHLLTDDDPSGHPFQFPQLDALGALAGVLRPALNQHVDQRPTAAQLRHQFEALLDNSPPGIEAPNGATVATPAALAAWIGSHWDDAAAWLYGRLPDQIEVQWGRSALARNLRTLLLRYPNDHDLGLDAALRLLDPAMPQPQVMSSPPTLAFGRVSQQVTAPVPLSLSLVGNGCLVLRLRCPAWLACEPSTCVVRPGKSVVVHVTLHPTSQQNPQLNGIIEVQSQHGQVLNIPVGGELYAQAPDGQELTDLAALVAWCEANRERAEWWLAASGPDSLPAVVDSAFGNQQLALQIRDMVRRLDRLQAAERALALDRVLARIDPQGYGAARPQLDVSPPTITSSLATIRTPQTLRITNTGRRVVVLRPDGPAWLRLEAPTARKLVPGETVTFNTRLDQQLLPLRGAAQGELRLADEATGGASLMVPVQATLPLPVRGALRSPRITLVAMLLLAALLWWAATAASQEISLALRYRAGEAALAQGNLPIARQEFEAVRAGRAGYAEAELRLQEIAYRLGSDALARSDWPTAQRELAAAGSYSDASALLRESYYRPAITALSEEQWDTAAALIASLEAYDPNYRDLAERIAAAPDLRGPLALARWSSGRVGPALSFENQNLRLLDGGPPYLIFAERAAITQVDLLTGETLDLPSPDYRDTDRYAVAFSPEKEWVAYYTDDSAVSVARSDGSVVHDLADTDGSQWLNFSPDGKVIATSTDNAVFFWRLADGQLLAEIPAWSSNGFLPVRFSPDSKTAAVMRGNDLLLVQPEDGSVVNRIEMEDLRTFDFNPDGTLIVAASYNTLTFVSVEERGEPRQEQIDTGEFNLGAVEELRFSPDGSRIALISTSGVLVRPLSGSENTIFIASGTSAAFSPDSQILAVGTEANKTGELILYDLRDSRLLQQIGMQAEEWYSSYNYRFDELTFNDDGSVLISQSRATGITVWRSLPQA